MLVFLLGGETIDLQRFCELEGRVMPKVKGPPPMAIVAATGEPPRRAIVITNRV